MFKDHQEAEASCSVVSPVSSRVDIAYFFYPDINNTLWKTKKAAYRYHRAFLKAYQHLIFLWQRKLSIHLTFSSGQENTIVVHCEKNLSLYDFSPYWVWGDTEVFYCAQEGKTLPVLRDLVAPAYPGMVRHFYCASDAMWSWQVFIIYSVN